MNQNSPDAATVVNRQLSTKLVRRVSAGFRKAACRLRLLVLLLLLLCPLGGASNAAAATRQTSGSNGGANTGAREKLLARRDQLEAEYTKALEKLATRCVELKLPELARLTRAWQIPRDPRRQYLFLPPPSRQQPAPARKDRTTAFWRDEIWERRTRQAKALLDLARDAATADQGALGYQWLHEALHEDPELEAARRVLGYQKVKEAWRLPTRQIRVRRVTSANPRLGFAARGHWRVQSGHFKILTNHSEAAGRALAEQLEDFHDVWRQAFFRYWSSAARLRNKFKSPQAATRGRQYTVVLFRSRADYLAALRSRQPGIEQSVGLYRDTDRSSYFYEGDGATATTRFHEVAHQLFAESGRIPRGPGVRANFWALEAVAMYLESYTRRQGYVTLGGFEADRLQVARYRRYFEPQTYVPLADLVRMGRSALQQRKDIARLYSQSTGLATMLMTGRRGADRAAFIAYLREIYRGRDTADSLSRLLGRPLAEVDRSYPGFLQVRDQDLLMRPPGPLTGRLLLGRTQVTDKGLSALEGQSALEWLDVSFTDVSDAGVAALAECRRLKHLNLEKTRITNRALAVAARLPLEELDLSQTAVTDDGLKQLAGLTRLTTLWLTGTSIGDAGLRHLTPLKTLESLALNQTRVTAAGVRALQQALPRLK